MKVEVLNVGRFEWDVSVNGNRLVSRESYAVADHIARLLRNPIDRMRNDSESAEVASSILDWYVRNVGCERCEVKAPEATIVQDVASGSIYCELCAEILGRAAWDQSPVFRQAAPTCPNEGCGRPLLPVLFLDAVWGCRECKETWHFPDWKPETAEV